MSTHEHQPLTNGQRWTLVAAALCAAGAVLLAALPMDWIEVVFGVEPDGGNGLFEFVPVVVLAVAALALCVRVARARRRADVAAADMG
jgi:uncharacterized membrane protein YedE/YeeE